MRALHLCEEKGSGIDKVVVLAKEYQLPAPDFRVGKVVLFAHQYFAKMGKKDRIRACYQHCCLMYLTNAAMSNQSLRKRFHLSDSSAATISTIIGSAKDAGLIKQDETESNSTRYAKYLPYWA